MTLRMDNVLIVVDDLDGAIAFFEQLEMELEGRMPIEEPWVDRTIGIDGTRAEIATMRTPDGHGRIELDKFYTPAAVTPEPNPLPINAYGIRRIMFNVDDIDAVLARLTAHGAELVDEVVDYQDIYRLCYVGGPEGILLGLAQDLRRESGSEPTA
ncbi:MAG: VOC family protein [Chloroflexota bacterium]|nr:VOC family protein [Chloroflexota bacterium]